MAGGGEVWERRRIVLSFAYLAFSTLLRLLVHGRRSVFAKEVELLVLRHQLSVLRRQQPRREQSANCRQDAHLRSRASSRERTTK
jgi:hypothetical protein